MQSERRPQQRYFEPPDRPLRQGDLFRDVPLAYPLPACEIVADVAPDPENARRFLSGPLETGFGILITPSCSMAQQGGGAADEYAHPVRTLVPVLPITSLEDLGLLDRSKHGIAEGRDGLINYMYVPSHADLDLPESLALLYMPVTLHHELIAANRVGQLSYPAAQQLQKKLVWHASGILLDRSDLDPPLD